ncbi:MAG: DUF2207 domain-containing protein [Caldisericia bacterium]|jgi:uncharacterized membrane protein|nr:DUF2207 domain-containing protein [Caldisericia bacterium]
MKKIIFLIIFLLFFIVDLNTSFAKDYSIPKVKIDVILNKDGSANFIEERTYTFQGNFTFGYYDLPKKGYESLELFEIYEGDILYKKDTSKILYTYFIEDRDSYYRINFYYTANDETKTFKFVYKLKGVIHVYEDYGEFYWKLQGEGWDKKIGEFESNIRLVSPIPKDEYFIWAHGPLWGEIKKIDDKTIYLYVNDVPPHKFVEVRVLIPSSYFTVETINKGNIKESVIKEETRWANEANRERIFAKINIWLPLLVFFLLIFLLIYQYLKYGKEFNIPKNYEYFREPPSDIKPAILGHLITFGAFQESFLKATIMDLIHQGIIDLEESSSSTKNLSFILDKGNYQKKESLLSEFEKILIDKILFDKGDRFTIKELNNKIRKNKEKYYYNFEKFKEEIKKESKNYDFFDKVSEKKSVFTIGLGCIIPVLSIILTVLFRNLFYLIWLILSPIYFITGFFAIKRRSFKGKEEFDKWMAFKRFLSDFSNLKEYGPKSIVLWEKYLIYGTVLGVSKTVLKALKIIFPQIEDIENGRLIGFAGTSHFSSFNKGLNYINSAITNIVSATSHSYKTSRSSWSSGGGRGGGFSGGGGGGGGGSGGGMG